MLNVFKYIKEGTIMNTKENVLAAFAGESQANRKYLAFAKKADEEGYHQVAKLFRAAAEAETIHAHAHLRAIDAVRSTTANLAEAIEGEHHEFISMYPEFITVAEQEGDKRALMSFKNAMAVEKVHYGFYSKALESVSEKKDLPPADMHICTVCGNTFSGSVPDKCPICNAPKDKFIEVK